MKNYQIIFLTFILLSLTFLCRPLAAVSFNNEEINRMLENSWSHYKNIMIAENGRPLCERDNEDIDADKNIDEYLTFSEGAGYVLLRAVYMHDRVTFDKVWNWTANNLWRKNISEIYYWGLEKGQGNFWQGLPGNKKDNLFAWRYCDSLGGREKGGVIYYSWSGDGCQWRDGLDSASDADQDIAAALVLADKQWGSEINGNKNYSNCASLILNDIWEREVKNVAGRFYLLAGDKYPEINGINPSYFRMAYYSGIFSAADPGHSWTLLVESSYRILVGCRDAALPDENGSLVKSRVNLPPNWIALDGAGNIRPNPWNKNGYLFGWDAFRLLYQVALHYKTTGDSAAASYLKDCLTAVFDFGPRSFLKEELKNRGRLSAGYRIDGSRTTREGLNREQAGQNGAYLAYFYAGGDLESAEIILSSLKTAYREKGYWGFNPEEYYQQNWAWFGLDFLSGQSLALYGVQPEPQVALK